MEEPGFVAHANTGYKDLRHSSSIVEGCLRIRYEVRRRVDGEKVARAAREKRTSLPICLKRTSLYRETKVRKRLAGRSTISAPLANSYRRRNSPGHTRCLPIRRKPPSAMNRHDAQGASSGSAWAPTRSSSWKHGPHGRDRLLSLPARSGHHTRGRKHWREEAPASAKSK
jgi:hypothetical protein